METIAVRLPDEIISEIDLYVLNLKKRFPMMNITRSDAIRELINNSLKKMIQKILIILNLNKVKVNLKKRKESFGNNQFLFKISFFCFSFKILKGGLVILQELSCILSDKISFKPETKPYELHAF